MNIYKGHVIVFLMQQVLLWHMYNSPVESRHSCQMAKWGYKCEFRWKTSLFQPDLAHFAICVGFVHSEWPWSASVFEYVSMNALSWVGLRPHANLFTEWVSSRPYPEAPWPASRQTALGCSVSRGRHLTSCKEYRRCWWRCWWSAKTPAARSYWVCGKWNT